MEKMCLKNKEYNNKKKGQFESHELQAIYHKEKCA